MKRASTALAWVGMAAALSVGGWSGTASAAPKKPAEQKPQAAPAHPAAAQPQAAAPAAGAPGEKIAFTFDDEAKMKEFVQLSQQRQLLILRMRALQSYFDDDQKLLGVINKKFTDDYKVDTKKNYSLDPKRRVLIERETPPASAAPGTAVDQTALAPTQ